MKRYELGYFFISAFLVIYLLITASFIHIYTPLWLFMAVVGVAIGVGAVIYLEFKCITQEENKKTIDNSNFEELMQRVEELTKKDKENDT